MSAQEFREWFVYMSREELLPEVERIRHAQVRAAVLTGPATAPSGHGGWSFTDLLDLNVWLPEPDPAEMPPLRVQIDALNRWMQ